MPNNPLDALGLVLVADDEPDVRQHCQTVLQRFGYETYAVTDGQEVVEALDAGLSPDVMLLDINMPRLDGLAVCEQVKAEREHQHLPVVLMTQGCHPEDVVRGLRAGADDYVHKPLQLEELRARMANLVLRKRMVDRLRRQNEQLDRHLGHKARSVADLFSLSLQMNRAESIIDLLEVLTNNLVHAFDCRRVSVLLPDRDDGYYRVRGAYGVPQELAEGVELPPASPAVKLLCEGGAPVVIHPSEDDTPLADYGRVMNLADAPLLVAPLLAGYEPMGLVNLLDRPQAAFTPDDSLTLQYVAQAAGVAIKNRLREDQLAETQDVTLFALARLAESRDKHTGNHLLRVQAYTRRLCEHLLQRDRRLGREMTPRFAAEVVRAAPLHDIGKVGIPDSILLKPGKLTADEFETMKRHTLIGGETIEAAERRLRGASFLTVAREICTFHHEKWDGTGYPYGRSGEAIPLAARVLAVADVYDALTTERSYKAAYDHATAVNVIRQQRGFHFDPRVVDAFLALQWTFDRIRRELTDPAVAVEAGAPAP